MPAWIVEHSDGSLTQHESAPGFTGIPLGRRRAQMPRLLANDGTETWDWTTGAIVADPTKVEALLIAAVKTEAEGRKMERATAGGYKKTEYADKAREVANADTLGTTVTAIAAAIGALSPAQQAARFPYAAASASAFGDTVAAAIARFRAGQSRAAPVTRIAAIEERACAQIRAATTAAAKRAAYAAISWS